jgi:hypothetical protein
MPRKYTLKFGGVNPGVKTRDSSIGLIIGLAIFCLCLLGVFSGIIAYFGFIRKTCKDKEDDEFKITCPTGKKLKNKVCENDCDEDECCEEKTCKDKDGDEFKITCPTGKKLKNKVCENDCDEDECCEEKICNPPSSLPAGYSGIPSTRTFKSVSDFNTLPVIEGVNCSQGYIGDTINANSCGNSNTWSYTGCTRDNNCLTGYNPGNYGNTISGNRSGISNCGSVDLLKDGHISSEDQQRQCNQFYNNTENNKKFCTWHDEYLNNCREGNSCT